MISRLDGLEKKDTNSKQMSVLESELRSTKDLLISLMAKFDKFSKETDEKFADFDCAIADIEGKMDTNTNGGQDINDDNAISCDLQSELNCDTEGITFEISEN
jgi:hypothetical protein